MSRRAKYDEDAGGFEHTYTKNPSTTTNNICYNTQNNKLSSPFLSSPAYLGEEDGENFDGQHLLSNSSNSSTTSFSCKLKNLISTEDVVQFADGLHIDDGSSVGSKSNSSRAASRKPQHSTGFATTHGKQQPQQHASTKTNNKLPKLNAKQRMIQAAIRGVVNSS